MEFVPDDKFTEKLIDEYSKYFNYDTNLQEKSFEEAIEENLTHLEEFCTVLDYIRNENNQNLLEQIPDLKDKIKNLDQMYSKVDKLICYLDEIKKTVLMVENELVKAENKLVNTNKLSNFFSKIIGNTKENSRTNLEVDNNFNFPQIFDSKNFFG